MEQEREGHAQGPLVWGDKCLKAARAAGKQYFDLERALAIAVVVSQVVIIRGCVQQARTVFLVLVLVPVVCQSQVLFESG